MKNSLNSIIEHSTSQLFANVKNAYSEILDSLIGSNGYADNCEFYCDFNYISNETIDDLVELAKSEYVSRSNEVLEAFQSDCYVTFNVSLKPLKSYENCILMEENCEILSFFNDFLRNNQFNIVELRDFILTNDRNYDDRGVLMDYIQSAIVQVNGCIEDLLYWKANCDDFCGLKTNEKILSFANKVLTRLHAIVLEVIEKDIV